MEDAKSIESNRTDEFEYVLKLITKAREKAIQRVNEELVKLYWNIGHWISRKNRTASYGDRYIAGLAAYIHKKQPELKGFDRRGLYRMKQFYETYKNLPKVSPLVTQLSWTNNLIILSSCKSDVEREFYIYLSIAVELKIGKFKPEYISKMDFYLEALDRQIKKPHENPRINGIPKNRS